MLKSFKLLILLLLFAFNSKGQNLKLPNMPDSFVFVNDSINATKIKVQLRWLSDFVLNKDYCQVSLCELENYIKLKRHLPAFKSEQELFKNGTQLAEKIALQQKQLEELTLYSIKLKKRIKSIEISNR